MTELEGGQLGVFNVWVKDVFYLKPDGIILSTHETNKKKSVVLHSFSVISEYFTSFQILCCDICKIYQHHRMSGPTFLGNSKAEMRWPNTLSSWVLNVYCRGIQCFPWEVIQMSVLTEKHFLLEEKASERKRYSIREGKCARTKDELEAHDWIKKISKILQHLSDNDCSLNGYIYNKHHLNGY